MNKVVEYIIGAKDKTAEAIKSALGRLRDWSKATVDETHKAIEAFRKRAIEMKKTLASEEDAFVKAHKSALSTYETLDELNRRIDAPKKAAQEAAKAQEEHNKALERYCRLVEEAKAREASRYAKKHYYNAFDPSTFGNLEKLHGGKGDGGGISGGLKNAMTSINGLAASAKRSVPLLMMMSNAMSQNTGAAGKMAHAISSIAGMTMMFGPLGAAIAGVQAAISAVGDYFVDKANKMLEKARELSAKATERLAKLKDTKFNALTDQMEIVAKSADRVTEAFDRAAEAKAKMASAKNNVATAHDLDELSEMHRKMHEDVDAVDDSDKERVGAAWRVEIAEKEAEARERGAMRELKIEEDAIRAAEKRYDLTEKNVKKLQAAESLAYKKYLHMRDLFGDEDPAYVRQYEKLYEAARERARTEEISSERQRHELETMRENKIANDIRRETSVADAYGAKEQAVRQYKQAEEKREKEADMAVAREIAQFEEEERAKAIQEERDTRMRMEREIARERKQLAKDLSAAQKEEAMAQARLDAATAKEKQAWGWYRDRDSWKAQLEEERADAEAQKQFDKDFESLKSRYRDWRTSDRLSDDDELIRRVALAREEKAAAEEYAKQTAEATQACADALEAIQDAITEEG